MTSSKHRKLVRDVLKERLVNGTDKERTEFRNQFAGECDSSVSNERIIDQMDSKELDLAVIQQIKFNLDKRRGVVQLAERRILVPDVGGSNPSTPAK